MDIIMVSRSKLKVILSGDDLDHYGTNADALDYSNCETRRVIEDILKKAKKDVGFDPVGDRMLVQLFPSRKGGCEIYVTKLEDEDTKEIKEIKETKETKEIKEVGEKRCQTDTDCFPLDKRKDRTETLISFSSADAMLLFCRRALKLANDAESKAYIWSAPDCASSKQFFILISSPSKGELEKLISFGVANEYGYLEEEELFGTILPERALCVCESRAIQKLSDL